MASPHNIGRLHRLILSEIPTYVIDVFFVGRISIRVNQQSLLNQAYAD